ncbi:TraB/GumN family protein [Paracoccus sp. S1E-3]|uniref:TraB/GumN family protein n=1 Tax=Paracoccus sp. S1E-3 TaxID=2756130 RepID=UPI0015EE871C|nr:TraB/GumN family protein [Paracoccus sp. S1E-3]MBA4492670.1 TraB/GumN family protein [Paracoccus sp. S1E-3]
MKRLIAALLIGLAAPAAHAAECAGSNLLAALPAADRAAIRSATDAVPFHQGILWQARKGKARITMVGTYHFDDPRHAAMRARLAPVIAEADALLVELGPKEEEQLKSAMLADPALMMDPTGPTLPERLQPEEWKAISAALADRGIPAIVASKMRPWYVAMMMGMSPCMLQQVAATGAANGLDWQLMAEAEGAGIPVVALEPWDTVLKLFGGLTPQQELDMIVYTLPAAQHADDYATTMTDAYFAGDVWQIWEFGRIDAYRNSGLPKAEVDRLTDEAQVLLMDARNRSWIAPLTAAADAAAARDKGVVAAFGALHLPGENGVLRLLEKAGWTIEKGE